MHRLNTTIDRLHRRYALLPFVCLIAFTIDAEGQTYTQRDDLATALNAAMTTLIGQLTSIPPGSNEVNVTIPSGITIKGFDGSCIEPASAVLRYIPTYTFPPPPMTVRLDVILRDGTTTGLSDMDVPGYSHEVVCALNNWMFHGVKGNRQQNWTGDGSSLVIDPDANFDACPVGSSQKFWMIDGDADYSGQQMDPDKAGIMWWPSKVYNGRFWNSATSTEYEGDIDGGEFASADNANKNVWIVRRHDANDGRMEARRAHTKIIFDYALPTGTEYVDEASEDPNWTFAGQLESIELTAQIHDYPGNTCLPAPPIAPLSGEAKFTMKLTYTGGSPGPIVCEKVWNTGSTPDDNNEAMWDWMEGDFARAWGEFDIDEDGFLFFGTRTECSGTPTTIEKLGLIKLRDRAVPPEQCEITLAMETSPLVGGYFAVDQMTGNLLYLDNSLDPQEEHLFCFDFCDPLSGYLTFDNVISASAQTFDDSWEYDSAEHGSWKPIMAPGSWNDDPLTNPLLDPYVGVADNPFQRGERGKWRTDRSYVYRSAVKSGIDGNYIYDAAGVFTDEAGNTADAFQLFDWRDPDDNIEKWLNPMTITGYAPSGEAVEEHNIIDVYGAVKLAHKGTVPRLAAQNTTYEAVDFESFEENTPIEELVSGSAPYTKAFAHSGEISYKLDDGGAYSGDLASVTLTDQIYDQGLLMKLWVKQTYNVFDANPSFSNPPIAVKVGAQTFSTLAPDDYNTLDPNLLHKVAQTGEWSLYQLVIDPGGFGSAGVGDPLPITVKNHIPTEHEDNVWVDDIRVQPLDAQMTCFVYDRHTLCMIGQFDDQHFGVYSRYNGEGNLVSVLRETERGVVTVSESHAWVLTQFRPLPGSGSSISPEVPDVPHFRGIDPDAFGPQSARSNGGMDFDIMSLRVGPQGPMVDLFDGKSVPLDNLSELLDFGADYPELDVDRLSSFAPDLSEIERLQVVRELVELEEERKKLEEKAADGLDEEEKEELQKGRDRIEKEQQKIMRDRLGLTDEEMDSLYRELRGESSQTDNSRGAE